MPLPAEEVRKVPDLTEETSPLSGDMLLLSRTGASRRITMANVLAWIAANINLSDYALLASPALTGTPTGPTAAPGTATTQLATTAFVDAVRTAILAVIDALTAGDVGADPAGSAAAAETAANSYAATLAADAETQAKAYADLLVAAALKLRGGYDASGNIWPSTGGTGAGGAIKEGNLWFVSVPGVLGGKQVVVGDAFFSVVDNPGQTSANWCVLDTNLGFVPEEAGTAAAAIVAHLLAVDPHGDRAYADALVASLNTIITTSGAFGDYAYIRRFDHFLGDEDAECFTLTGFTNAQSWSDTLRGNITGASAWRGVATHQVSTSSGQRRFNFGGGYGASVAGSATATLNWVAGDKYQFIWRGAISAVPDGSNRFCLSFGFSTRGNVDGYNPSVTAGYSHALIWADESSGFWQCSSRSATGASEQTTVTAVAVAAMTEITTHVVVAATGNVEFYINNVLVATHSEGGKILAGDKLIPQLTWNNKATIAATRYLYSDCVGYLMAFGSQAAGLAWR